MTVNSKRIAPTRALILCAAVLSTGCMSNPYQWDTKNAAHMEATLEQAGRETGAPVPADVSKALLPPIAVRVPEGGAEPLEARFDLSLNNAAARNVFMGLVEGTPYSMLVPADVSGTMTLHLKNTTVPEAMEAIRRVYGYDYKRDGSRFLVLGRGMQTRIYPVNYLNLNRKGKSTVNVSSGELTASKSGSGSSATTTSEQGHSMQVETETQTDFWKDLKETLTAMIGSEGGRKVMVNAQTGIVMVRAMPDELRVAEDYLGLTAATVNRQVILEAKILNVQLSDGYQTGINWSRLQGSSVFGQVGGGTIFNGGGVSEIAGNPGDLAGTLPTGTNTSAFGGVFSIATAASDFSAFVELLKTQGDVHVLSSPRVSTINNQKAVIKVGGDEFFITGITSTPSGIVGVPPTTTVELTPFFSGVALDVTPQIDENSNIILHIHPSVSEVMKKDLSYTIDSKGSSLPLAASSIQESDNVVRALSGQFVIIGGLMKEGTTDDNAGIPFLGDIPVVGNLFKHKRVTRIKNELVILLKPTIVDAADSRTWGNLIQESHGRMKQLEH
jgi:MSHA biogenesis protein MshL